MGVPGCQAQFPSGIFFQEETNSGFFFFFLVQSISFQHRDVHTGLPLSQGHPRVAALRGCPGAGPVGSEAAPPLRPAAIPGPDRVNLGAAGRGGTCRQMSVSSLCQQPGGSVQAQEMLQGGPRTFFFFSFCRAELALVGVQ